ncbi:DUF192 domain-containing protein [Candidimonas humi]|uniref:DUF192 domain-containing protein n=1 Tax=Candidimonas humi TaxID=683355 RepID=A0ABV8NVM1_9BURK|nr:DUF192 domain-containing protein [Candidimonas humi]MBV6303277.1 DUF192 domain-containing protein [Candidimonas humi]
MTAPRSAFRLYVARSPWQRLLGMHAYAFPADGWALWLDPCRAVHTFGLARPIDLLFLDSRLRVSRRIDSLAPGRVAWCRAARSVLELPAGYCAAWPGHAQLAREAMSRWDSSCRTR